jgi:hypothetical protein
MTNRKIESDRLADAIEAFRQRASEPTLSPGIGDTDFAPETVADTSATDAPTADHRASTTTIPSLRQAIADFVTPKITHSGLLQGPRATLLLEQLVSHILPMLGGSDELRELASTVLEDEMGRHQDVTSRIHEGLAA